jgi:hypothetical protein
MDLLVPKNMLGPGMDWHRDILECHIHRCME